MINWTRGEVASRFALRPPAGRVSLPRERPTSAAISDAIDFYVLNEASRNIVEIGDTIGRETREEICPSFS